MDTTQYLGVFIDESREHLDVLYNQLLVLEKQPGEKPVIEEIFRAAHTLKGMSATMGYTDLANLTHKMENVLDAIRYEKITVNTEIMDVLFEAGEALEVIVNDIENGGTGAQDVSQIVNLLDDIEQGNSTQRDHIEEPSQEDSHTFTEVLDEFELSILNESETRGYANYEVTVQLREDCLLKAARVFMVFEVLEKMGEVIKSVPTVHELEEENFDTSFLVLLVSEHSKDEIKELIQKVSEVEHVSINTFSVASYKHEQDQQAVKQEATEAEDSNNDDQDATINTKKTVTKTIRVNIDRLDALMNLFEELVIDRGRLEQISGELKNPDLEDTVERMTRISGDLQNIILNMRMVPIDQVFNRFPRMIRQLARDLDKQVGIEITGADTELDRTVIDEIGDPLVHLIRNAVDHGIESREIRQRDGKPEEGTLNLKAYHSGNHVIIEISDDGAGINKDKVLNKAIAKGIVTADEAAIMSDQQIYELIMASGFSTAEQISDVSGRGVGLDVVKNTIESLGGRMSVNATTGQGSTFSIELPLTLSIMSVLLVELGTETYAIPLSSIMETAVVSRETIMHAHNKKVIDFRGQVVPLAFLNELFETGEMKEDEQDISIVIVKKGDKLTGLVVDDLIGQQEVVLKSMGNYLTNTFAISGATILGDGRVALIIDSNALVR
ncbi:Histidine kinase [Lentibacillus sp. JNUCC-1]|uniref:chemotaxis protein CheA n=1 Tax=Lentibacillus sp. JNUCC-1 TaxID=2654513 RepID=UPI0012E73EFB|nr:chemotaxis protein CheA [Lentibacillus sp. JNUCC-1]MUV39940.1 Histidine kinase [Lentibacillus sp. JNUCC-1]